MKILIVDDEKNNRLLLEEILEDMGDVRLDFCISGDEALEAIKTQAYQVVFLDFQLPMMNGREIVEALDQVAIEDIPKIIMVTGSAHHDLEVIQHPLIAEWVRKPLSKKRVLDKLNKVLVGDVNG